jgi:hypothetical protein
MSSHKEHKGHEMEKEKRVGEWFWSVLLCVRCALCGHSTSSIRTGISVG